MDWEDLPYYLKQKNKTKKNQTNKKTHQTASPTQPMTAMLRLYAYPALTAWAVLVKAAIYLHTSKTPGDDEWAWRQLYMKCIFLNTSRNVSL